MVLSAVTAGNTVMRNKVAAGFFAADCCGWLPVVVWICAVYDLSQAGRGTGGQGY